jgi:hypothetical protein
MDYKAVNNRMIGLDRQYNVESLEASLWQKYLAKAMVKDANGVDMLQTDFTAGGVDSIANDWFGQIEYQIGKRHFNMDDADYNKSKSTTDPSGRSVLQTLAKALTPGQTAKTLTDILNVNLSNVDTHTAKKAMNGVFQTYDQTILVNELKDELGDDPKDWINALQNLNSKYSFAPTTNAFDQLTKNKSVDELMKTYVNWVFNARARDRGWV